MTTTEQKLTLAHEALRRIALNIYGDTVPQVVAGDALEKIDAIATESAPAAGAVIPTALDLASADVLRLEQELETAVKRAEKAEAALAQSAAGGTPVIFMGVDPLAIGAGAVNPMVPDSWRFGFYQINGELRFGFSDNGPLVAWDAVEPMLAARAVGGVDERAGPDLSDDAIVVALHAQGIDTYPSKYGFSELQVSATCLPQIRRVMERLLMVQKQKAAAAPVGDGDERALMVDPWENDLPLCPSDAEIINAMECEIKAWRAALTQQKDR